MIHQKASRVISLHCQVVKKRKKGREKAQKEESEEDETNAKESFHDIAYLKRHFSFTTTRQRVCATLFCARDAKWWSQKEEKKKENFFYMPFMQIFNILVSIFSSFFWVSFFLSLFLKKPRSLIVYCSFVSFLQLEYYCVYIIITISIMSSKQASTTQQRPPGDC